MKNILTALLFFSCAIIDFTFAYFVINALYGVDAGALLTLTITPIGFGVICLAGGIYTLIKEKE